MDEGCFFQPFFQSKMGVFDIAGKKVFSVKNANDFAIVVLKYRNPGEAVVGKIFRAFWFPSEMSMAIISTRGS